MFYYSGGENGGLSIVSLQSGTNVWCFDYPTGEFQAKEREGSGFTLAALVASGKPWHTESPIIVSSVDETMVKYALIPI